VAPVLPRVGAGLPARGPELRDPLVELLLCLRLEVEAWAAVVVHLEGEGRVLLGLGEVSEIDACERERDRDFVSNTSLFLLSRSPPPPLF
jgi:hypothetical protein